MNDDDSFVLPAFHFIEQIVTDKLVTSGAFNVHYGVSGDDPFGQFNVGGAAGTRVVVNSASLLAWEVDKTIDIVSQSGWSGREINVWILITSLGVD
jgi:hypothetical protein